MTGDAWMVLALMLGLLAMLGLGLWCELEDDTREVLCEARSALLAGAGAAAGVLLVLIAA